MVKKSTFIIFAAFFLAACVPKQEAVLINRLRISEGTAPWIIAHGGAKKLFPGNSMMAFRASAEMEVDMLEMDLRLSKDGILVTHHDQSIDRMSNGKGNVSDYNYEDLLAFNFGHSFQDLTGNFPYQNGRVPICKLADVFAEFPHMQLMVELKDRGKIGKKLRKY